MDGYNGDEISDSEWDAADEERAGNAFTVSTQGPELHMRHIRNVVERNVRFSLSADEVAAAIVRMDNDTQAEFLLRLALQWNSMSGDGALQMSWVADALTTDERRIVADFLEELRGYIQPEQDVA